LLNFLTFTQVADKITVKAPASANIAPPGHYMLFVLNAKGVPSIGHIAHISDTSVAALVHHAAFALLRAGSTPKVVQPEVLDLATARQHGKIPVVVGVTPTCPYGISACWAGAYDGLNQMSGVEKVWPRPDGKDSTAFVFLEDAILPDIDLWRAEFAAAANGSYVFRGIELTLDGTVNESNGLLTLAGNATRPQVVLAPLQGPDKVQWDINTRENWPMLPEEETAYTRLSAKLAKAPDAAKIEVMGPLKNDGKEFSLEVRTASINSVAV
jgi:galactose oxidase